MENITESILLTNTKSKQKCAISGKELSVGEESMKIFNYSDKNKNNFCKSVWIKISEIGTLRNCLKKINKRRPPHPNISIKFTNFNLMEPKYVICPYCLNSIRESKYSIYFSNGDVQMHINCSSSFGKEIEDLMKENMCIQKRVISRDI